MHSSHTNTTSNLPPPHETYEKEEEWDCALSKGMRKRLRAKGLTFPASFDFNKHQSRTSSMMSITKHNLLALPEDSPAAVNAKFNIAYVAFIRSTFLTGVRETIRNVLVTLKGGCGTKMGILCLGLGNPSVDRSSLRQFAFLSALVESVPQLSAGKTFLYDPLFRRTSRDFIRHKGFQLIKLNKEGKYRLSIDEVTLVFLPHCPLDLAEALVTTNWSRTAISRLLFFSCPVTPRNEADASFLPRLKLLAPFRHSRRLPKEEVDFEAMRIEWFDLEGVSDNFFDTTHPPPPPSSRTSDVLTSEHITAFVDDTETSVETFANL